MGTFFPLDSDPMVYFIIWEMQGFPHQFLIVRKMKQNPLYGVNLGNWYSYFSHSMGDFSTYDSHPTIYFIIWEMHGCPHQFPIVQENATKFIVWRENGKLMLILFPYYGHFFPLGFHFVVCFITWEMHVFSH